MPSSNFQTQKIDFFFLDSKQVFIPGNSLTMILCLDAKAFRLLMSRLPSSTAQITDCDSQIRKCLLIESQYNYGTQVLYNVKQRKTQDVFFFSEFWRDIGFKNYCTDPTTSVSFPLSLPKKTACENHGRRHTADKVIDQ